MIDSASPICGIKEKGITMAKYIRVAKTGFLQFPFNCSLANTLYSLFSTEHIFIHGNNLKGSNFGVRNTTL